MPIPKLHFEDAASGLPPEALPVRFACLATGWNPSIFIGVVTGSMNAYRPLIKVMELDPTTQRTGVVSPATYESFCNQLAGKSLCDQLSVIPANHFVWSDDLVWAFSNFIDLTVGRESNPEGIRWQPALEGCGAVVDQCIDVSSLSRDGILVSKLRIGAKSCMADFNGATGQFKDSKGLRYLVELLKQPLTEISVENLNQLVNPSLSGSSGTSDHQLDDLLERSALGDETEGGIRIGALADGMEAIDKEALQQYRARISTLDDEINDALNRNDQKEHEKLESEREAILEHIGKSVDKTGKPRTVGGTHEKLRKAVGIAISRALEDIERGHPTLGAHLAESIERGSDCSYKPALPMSWAITIVPPAPDA